MSVLAGVQERQEGRPYCELVAAKHGCAREDCCQLSPPGRECDLEDVVGRVVEEALEHHIETPPFPKALSLIWVDEAGYVAQAIQAALADAFPDASLRVALHPDSASDHRWVYRYQVRLANESPLADFVMGAGLCVVASRDRLQIILPPTSHARLAATARSKRRRQR